MMKKILLLLAAVLLIAATAAAEEAETPVIPVEIIAQEEGMLHITEAVAKAEAHVQGLPAGCVSRAELVRMSDDSCQWIVTIYNEESIFDLWSVGVDAVSGEVMTYDWTNNGYFWELAERWEKVKGTEALWTLEDRQLFDVLYRREMYYGMPVEGDMAQSAALTVAVEALGLTSVSDYEIGYGYILGADDGLTNGVWEVFFVQNGECVYKVNLDAVNGDIYLLEPDESGNG